MGLSVHSRISNGRNSYGPTSIGHSASGLRTYARVIPAGVYRPPSRRTQRYISPRWSPTLNSRCVGVTPVRPFTMSLIKSHRVLATDPPPHFFVAVSNVQRWEYLSITKLRFTILSVERTDKDTCRDTLSLSPSVHFSGTTGEGKEWGTQRSLRNHPSGLIRKRNERKKKEIWFPDKSTSVNCCVQLARPCQRVIFGLCTRDCVRAMHHAPRWSVTRQHRGSILSGPKIDP